LDESLSTSSIKPLVIASSSFSAMVYLYVLTCFTT
jgi:hypothetical protein